MIILIINRRTEWPSGRQQLSRPPSPNWAWQKPTGAQIEILPNIGIRTRAFGGATPAHLAPYEKKNNSKYIVSVYLKCIFHNIIIYSMMERLMLFKLCETFNNMCYV